MGSTAGVMSREDGIEQDHTISAAGLDASKHSIVEFAFINCSANITGSNSAIHTLNRHFQEEFRDADVLTVLLQCHISSITPVRGSQVLTSRT